MQVTARLNNALNEHQLTVQTNEDVKALSIDPKAGGLGSSVNGAELLLAALATCYCNDIYREAAKRNLEVSQVEVVFSCQFGGVGEPGSEFEYKANIKSTATKEEIDDLLRHTDQVAEIHNTLRRGVPVKLVQ